MSEQGNKVGMDSSKFGLKFDACKSRIDLIDIESLVKIPYYTVHDGEGLEYYNKLISGSYVELLLRIKYNGDEGTIKYNDDILRYIGDIVSCALKFLDCKYTVNLLKQLGDLYAYGAKLYGDDNWKRVNVQRYISALGRHIDLVVTDNRYDSESGMHHAIHIVWNCIAIVHKMVV